MTAASDFLLACPLTLLVRNQQEMLETVITGPGEAAMVGNLSWFLTTGMMMTWLQGCFDNQNSESPSFSAFQSSNGRWMNGCKLRTVCISCDVDVFRAKSLKFQFITYRNTPPSILIQMDWTYSIFTISLSVSLIRALDAGDLNLDWELCTLCNKILILHKGICMHTEAICV